MKKSIKYIAIVLAVVCLGVLIVLNKKNAAVDDAHAAAGEIVVETADGEKVYAYQETGDDYVTFDTEMRRKNGDVFPKTYSGRELSAVLDDLGIPVDDRTEITAICADQYEISLSGTEVLESGNVYIVSREGGEVLDEESGPFMLVVNGDEFATRWGKNIVRIRISE